MDLVSSSLHLEQVRFSKPSASSVASVTVCHSPKVCEHGSLGIDLVSSSLHLEQTRFSRPSASSVASVTVCHSPKV